jgi:hypothetical protein
MIEIRVAAYLGFRRLEDLPGDGIMSGFVMVASLGEWSVGRYVELGSQSTWNSDAP